MIEAGDLVLVRDARAASSYLASNDPAAHAGLGERTIVDSVLVRWVDGGEERFGPLEVDRTHTLRRGAGESAPDRRSQ